jgi:hypothetical protein
VNLEFLVWFAVFVGVAIGALVWLAMGELPEIEPLEPDLPGPERGPDLDLFGVG